MSIDRKRLNRRPAVVGVVITAAVFVAVAAVVAAIRQGDWTPVAQVGWLPAVVAALFYGSGRARRCPPRAGDRTLP